MTTLSVLFCPDCSAEQSFERPGCEDGHGPDCVELCCVQCGTAMLIGDLPALSTDDRLMPAQVPAVAVERAA
jgi:hypothetical protein